MIKIKAYDRGGNCLGFFEVPKQGTYPIVLFGSKTFILNGIVSDGSAYYQHTDSKRLRVLHHE